MLFVLDRFEADATADIAMPGLSGWEVARKRSATVEERRCSCHGVKGMRFASLRIGGAQHLNVFHSYGDC